MPLHAIHSGGPDGAVPLVLLHGFGGTASDWMPVIHVLAGTVPVLAYDLPGHGGSLDAPEPGGAGRMARAVRLDLEARGLTRFHLCGHSLGGAVAAILALKAPEIVESLTLLAPGGLGPAINHRVLKRYACPLDRGELRLALEALRGFNASVTREMVERVWEDRSRAGARAALETVFDAMMRSGVGGRMEQGTLAMVDLARLPIPVSLAWGEQDGILPRPNEGELPGNTRYHCWPGVGHMLIDEAPQAVATLLADMVASRR